jgi:tetratricopeptide (TPR) repeat protein
MNRADEQANPRSDDSPAALYEEGLSHFRAGRTAAAEARCRTILGARPGHADSLHLIGLIRAQENQIDLAIELIAEAIRNDQTKPDYFSNLGTLLALRERFEEALKSYDLSLKLKPDAGEVWIRLGDLLRRQDRFDEALLTYDHARALGPRHVEAANKAGALLLDLGRAEEALARFELSDTIEPGQPQTLYNKGLCLTRLSRLDEAAAIYRQLLAIDPENYEGWNNLGGVLMDLGRLEEAETQFRNAIELRPDAVAAFNNLGLALTRLKRFDEAIGALDRAVAMEPDRAEPFNARANALKLLNRLDEALQDYDRAIALKPDYAEAYSNRGTCLDDMARPDDALSDFRKAIALRPDYGDAHWNLAVNRLRAGDLRPGWIEAEWRWKSGSLALHSRAFGKPLWLGASAIDGKVLLLHNDQGLGDAIQFCRYIPLLAERGARVVLQIDAPLKALLAGVAGVAQCLAKNEAVPEYDLHCPLSSLPLAFDTALGTIPSAIPYISRAESGVDWEAWLGRRSAPRVGLVWSGNPNHLNDHNRSIALKALAPLLDLGAQFVSLQKNARLLDQAWLRERSDILDADPKLSSFADTAALMQHLDLVISVDTSVAHLAGALGRPVWILLPYVPDWRWLSGRADSPWYPTARLFRQSSSRQWDSVIGEVLAALRQFVAGKP